MNITWSITQLERKVADDSIIIAHYKVTGDSGGYQAEAAGLCFFTPDPSSTNYIPYADVVEADVISWVKATLDAGDVTSIEAGVAADVNNQINPQVLLGKPWEAVDTTPASSEDPTVTT